MTELEELVQKIENFEKIISTWEPSQQDVVLGLKKTLVSLHNHAFIHFFKSNKKESTSLLLHTDIEGMVYQLLFDNQLIEVPKVPLLQRLQLTVDKIRPYLQKYHNTIELVSFKPSDTLEICLVDNSGDHVPAKLSLLPKIEKSIKYFCPEITKIITI